VAYRETIRKEGGGEANTFVRPVAADNTDTPRSRLEPQEPGLGLRVGQRHHWRFGSERIHQPIDQGIPRRRSKARLAGYEMVDVKATLYDGSSTMVDSNEMAFKIAGSMAFKEAPQGFSGIA